MAHIFWIDPEESWELSEVMGAESFNAMSFKQWSEDEMNEELARRSRHGFRFMVKR